MSSDASSSVDRRWFPQSASLAAVAPYTLVDASARREEGDDELPALRTKLLSVVPEPVVPGRPDLKEMYEACWVIGYKQTHHGTPGNGFVR